MNKRTAEHAGIATIVRVGLDTSKKYVQVHGVNAAEQPILRKQLRREDVMSFFANLPPCLIGLEACSSSHYWVRALGKLGHTVKMMAASFVAPYRKNRAGKNDANDAEAICEAVGRPNMRFVSVKSEEQQAILALHNVRHGLIEERTAVLNRLRGELAEFGLWFPTSPHQAKRGAALLLAQAECQLPPVLKSVVQDLLAHVRYLEERIDAYDRQIAEQLKHNEAAQRIRALIGVGDLTTSAALVIIGDARLFKNEWPAIWRIPWSDAQTSQYRRPNQVGQDHQAGQYVFTYLADPGRALCPAVGHAKSAGQADTIGQLDGELACESRLSQDIGRYCQ